MTDQPTTREDSVDAQMVDAQINELIGEADKAAGVHAPAPRDALDREEQLIRDAVLRMGALVEAAIRRRAGRSSRTTRPSRSTSSRATPSSTRPSGASLVSSR